MRGRRSWVPGADASGFSLDNLPYGIRRGSASTVVVAIGEYALDLAACAAAGLLDGLGAPREVWAQPSLNAFIELGPRVHRAVRRRLQALLGGARPRPAVEACLADRRSLVLALPVQPGDFTDFYASYFHTERSMRVADPTAKPGTNWLSMPLGYHSRTAAFAGDGARIHRPHGQRGTRDGPRYEPSRAVDFELEVGFVLARGSRPGERLAPADFTERVFGLALLNDWSARDLQAWESAPLGPFQAKSFATQFGPWVTPLEAVLPAGSRNESQATAAGYLQHDQPFTFDIELSAAFRTAAMRKRGQPPQVVSRTNLRHMHWDPAQQLAQLAANGAPTRPCDVYGTGTVSGPDHGSSGCLLELTSGGRAPLTLPSGEERRWLEDGDEVVLSGAAVLGGVVIADLGSLSGRLVAPREPRAGVRRSP